MTGPRPVAGIERIRPHMASAERPGLPPARILLHSNESAFGPGPHALEAARKSLSSVHRYVEFQDSILAPALGAHYGLDPDWIAAGQGSDDLIARLARVYLPPGTELVRWANGYLKVPNYAYANGADVVSVEAEPFRVTVDALLAAITPRTRIVYLANPENPAGTALSGRDMLRLRDEVPKDVLLIVDAAYEEYVDAPEALASAKLVADRRNVVMCRTFSKVFGLAGARVGWIHAHPDILDPVRRVGLTFPISSPSIAAALAALEDRAHSEHVATETKRLRRWLSKTLAGLGLEVIPSQANFLLVRCPEPERSAAGAVAALREEGILLRRFNAPAYDECLRITIGLQHELQEAVDALARYLGTNPP